MYPIQSGCFSHSQTNPICFYISHSRLVGDNNYQTWLEERASQQGYSVPIQYPPIILHLSTRSFFLMKISKRQERHRCTLYTHLNIVYFKSDQSYKHSARPFNNWQVMGGWLTARALVVWGKCQADLNLSCIPLFSKSTMPSLCITLTTNLFFLYSFIAQLRSWSLYGELITFCATHILTFCFLRLFAIAHTLNISLQYLSTYHW